MSQKHSKNEQNKYMWKQNQFGIALEGNVKYKELYFQLYWTFLLPYMIFHFSIA